MNANKAAPVRVRFAPSPTGSLHIGGARTAYFNWLFARKGHGAFILRIDDTDQKRSTETSYNQILNSFRWLGMDWDEGPDVGGPHAPYRQSQRYDIYWNDLLRLQESNLVYPCFCSQEELAAQREAANKQGVTARYSGCCRHLSAAERLVKLESGITPIYRLRVPQDGTTTVHDIVRGDVVFQNDGLDDFIVWKADNSPTYHFASCVDDGQMEISHIIRADEHLSNTARHVLLFEALGYATPQFAHVPMILAPDRSKLSKRHGATSVEEYRDAGILPEALVNYLLLLGFSPGEDKEIVSREQAVEAFDLTRVTKSAAVYDVKKLEWMNAQYLRSMPIDQLLATVWPSLIQRQWVSQGIGREQIAWVRLLLAAMQERARSFPELLNSLQVFFEAVSGYDLKGVKKHFTVAGVAERLRAAADALELVDTFTNGQIEACYRDLIDRLGIKGGELIHPTRLALTGVTVGPGLFEIMALLGKRVCQERLRFAAEQIQAQQLPGLSEDQA